ncbi:DNA repair protein RecO [Allohahella marinimesophila]|uniref:DNA repair protein RecO n=1 Tax=Allohahella marinimesophila TaxID=1054972 RepID=A0ABP7Q4R9_9GAMM
MTAPGGGSSAVAQQGWLLHGRRYRENSVIATMLTASSGKVSGVVHGSRGKSRSAADSLQSFQPYSFSQYGRSDLKNFSSLDFAGRGFGLRGRAALVGLYFNELLYLLLPEEERVPEIFALYTSSLQRLVDSVHEPAAASDAVAAFSAQDPALRLMREFELTLTTELGLHPGFASDAAGDQIQAGIRYVFISSTGWLPEVQAVGEPSHLAILSASGRLLQAVGAADWQVNGALGLARQLTAAVIDRSLDGRTLNTRQLIQDAARLDLARLATLRGAQSESTNEDHRHHDN